MSFTRKIENFTCEHCKAKIIGNGYTNHCSNCLWSKHVDIEPGDRAAECEGMMQPVSIEMKAGETMIVHKCVTCGYAKKNKTAGDDNLDEITKIISYTNYV